MPVKSILPPDIFRIHLPLIFALDHVNCYLIIGEQGWEVVDAGLSTSESCRYWNRAVRELGLNWQQLRGIYITHYHPDHYGAAGWLQNQSGAPVYMLSAGLKEVEIAWGNYEVLFSEYSSFCRRHGMPDRLIEELLANVERAAYTVYPQPQVTTLEDGHEVRLGDRLGQVLWTPGHADGHYCLYSSQDKLLFSGDHLLPSITSNISLWPGSQPNPLLNYFSSLKKISTLNIDLILPAHGDTFGDLAGRVEMLYLHHRERLKFMAKLAAPGVDAYNICRKVFGWNLTVQEIQFAFSETLAHLVYLEQEQVLESVSDQGVILFRRGPNLDG
ncbi:MAG TPA: MBL fold metallo-hydrolase [Firmicutes bacterium]|nr:MBL fold metallo-hydrolase [Bacillota bacterium]